MPQSLASEVQDLHLASAGDGRGGVIVALDNVPGILPNGQLGTALGEAEEKCILVYLWVLNTGGLACCIGVPGKDTGVVTR